MLSCCYRNGGDVGNLTTRNVDDRVIDLLRAQAKANQRSLEGEIRYMLTQQVDRCTRIAGSASARARLHK